MNNYFEIVLRSGAVYLFMIFAIRLFGKKELSQLNITDLILILLISNSVQNAMVGPDNSLQGGLVAAFCLFTFNFIIKKVVYKFPALEKAIEGEAVILVYKGVVNKINLKNEYIDMQELEEVVREHGVNGVANVALAVLERDGNISVVSNELVAQSMHKRKPSRHGKWRNY